MLMRDNVKALMQEAKKRITPTRFITKSGKVLTADECGRGGLIVKLNINKQ